MMTGIVRSKGVMPSPLSGRTLFLLCGIVWAICAQRILAQGFGPEGGEYSLSGTAVGDQMNPQVSVSPSGGYVVWQDNAVDGKAMGIAARRLDQSFSAPFGAFRVNQIRAGYQEKPQVTM